MYRRSLIVAGLAMPVPFAFCMSAPETGANMQDDQTTEIAPGKDRDFSFTVSTNAPDEVWRLWTTPSTWGAWDRGLQSASMTGEMGLGSTGRMQPRNGPASNFKVVLFDPKNAYAFVTKLPLARLRVERSFNADRTAFTHHVTFKGPLAFAFARMFGPRFRRALPPTMCRLNTLAEEA